MPCKLNFYPLVTENWHGRIRGSDVTSRRMALKTHNLPSGRLKTRLWWIRWRHFSRCRKAKRTHFLHPWNQKKRPGQSRASGFKYANGYEN
jgi:hypothetical protein